jgi:hypothetical protein
VAGLLLFGYVLRILRNGSYYLSQTMHVWRYAFLSGFVALLVNNIFNDHLYDRPLWMAVAFAAALEINRRTREADKESGTTHKELGGVTPG